MSKQKTSPPVDETPPPSASETYTVLARRYRPQQFADLVGQEAIARALVNAIKSNRVAHAYLFTGARGVGKTSTARILAKALNCVQGPTPTPCDVCDICLSIAGGEDVDVLEIDGASNNKVEEVRELRSNVQYRPARARYKVYIIDEVHMLSTSAFNALLKTLEEPPPHVKFIFATTEVQKIPITILSRCQRFDFGGISTARIVERLRRIVAAERLPADDDALELIARRASGSMRDAQSLLDQLLAFGSERLSADQVHHLLGTARDDRVLALATAVLEHDPKRALELLGQGVDEGLHLGELLDQLIDYWRDLMVLHCAGSAAQDLSVAPRHRATLTRQASALSLDSILAGLDILNTTRARLRGSVHARVLLEMALVRLGRLAHLVALAQVSHWLNDAERAVPLNPAAPRTVRQAAPGPEEDLKKKPPPPAEAQETERPTLSEHSLPTLWQEMLTQVGGMLAGHLEKAGLPAITGPNTLVLRFPPRYNHEYAFCQEPERYQRIEAVLRTLVGQQFQLRIETAGSGAAPEPDNVAAGATSPPRSRQQRAEAVPEPLLRRAIDVLGAQVVHMDEGFGVVPATAVERPPDTEET